MYGTTSFAPSAQFRHIASCPPPPASGRGTPSPPPSPSPPVMLATAPQLVLSRRQRGIPQKERNMGRLCRVEELSRGNFCTHKALIIQCPFRADSYPITKLVIRSKNLFKIT